jgi:hypothetical protein
VWNSEPTDCADAVADIGVRHIESHRHVVAADVAAGTADQGVLLIGDDAARRSRAAEMFVGTHHAADAHASRHLRLGARIMLADDHEIHGALLGLGRGRAGC